MRQRILIVEDEQGLRLTLSDRLRNEGYEVDTASDGAEGYERASRLPFDLIVLDLMLPEKSGLDICRDLRRMGVTTPVLMLTALGQTHDKVAGLKIGADDYLTKPFEMAELLARIEALLRRQDTPPRPPSSAYEFGAVRMDVRSTQTYRDEKEVTLSAKEFTLLRYLLEHRGETLSREKLLHEVWGYDNMPSTRTVDVHVAWLRQKLEDDPKKPRWILTVHGLGYKFADQKEPADPVTGA
jgi:two-component system alkaline phosphatase synthesis response regulator PhoP